MSERGAILALLAAKRSPCDRGAKFATVSDGYFCFQSVRLML